MMGWMAPLRHLGAKVLCSRCTGSMQRERRFCAGSFARRSCWHSSVDYRAVWLDGGVCDGALLGAGTACAGT